MRPCRPRPSLGRPRRKTRLKRQEPLPGDDKLTFREASRLAFLRKGSITGSGAYKPPPLGGMFKGAAVDTSPAYGCSAQVVEVTVDIEAGQVMVDKVTDAHDCGRAST